MTSNIIQTILSKYENIKTLYENPITKPLVQELLKTFETEFDGYVKKNESETKKDNEKFTQIQKSCDQMMEWFHKMPPSFNDHSLNLQIKKLSSHSSDTISIDEETKQVQKKSKIEKVDFEEEMNGFFSDPPHTPQKTPQQLTETISIPASQEDESFKFDVENEYDFYLLPMIRSEQEFLKKPLEDLKTYACGEINPDLAHPFKLKKGKEKKNLLPISLICFCEMQWKLLGEKNSVIRYIEKVQKSLDPQDNDTEILIPKFINLRLHCEEYLEHLRKSNH